MERAPIALDGEWHGSWVVSFRPIISAGNDGTSHDLIVARVRTPATSRAAGRRAYCERRDRPRSLRSNHGPFGQNLFTDADLRLRTLLSRLGPWLEDEAFGPSSGSG
jgi:hypothetical protein